MSSSLPGARGVEGADPVSDRNSLITFRGELYECFERRADALFELTDAVLTGPDRVWSLVELSQEKVFRRGHGALYDALACGRVDTAAVGRLLAGAWAPVDAGPVKVAVDVVAWPRPDAETSPQRCHCYHSCRCDGARKTIPGWPYSFAAGLDRGTSSWTAPLDAVRLGPDADATVVGVEQIARVVARLATAGHLAGRAAPLFVFDAGYDLTRISYLSADQGLDVQILGRVRADRVYYATPPAGAGRVGRPPRHGPRFALDDPTTWPAPAEQVHADSPRYGHVRVTAWHGLHQKLSRQGGWSQFEGVLPIVTGTVIRIQVDRLPGHRIPQDVWLWNTAPTGTVFDLDLLWKTYLRRFDLEHTFRFFQAAARLDRPPDHHARAG